MEHFSQLNKEHWSLYVDLTAIIQQADACLTTLPVQITDEIAPHSPEALMTIIQMVITGGQIPIRLMDCRMCAEMVKVIQVIFMHIGFCFAECDLGSLVWLPRIG